MLGRMGAAAATDGQALLLAVGTPFYAFTWAKTASQDVNMGVHFGVREQHGR